MEQNLIRRRVWRIGQVQRRVIQVENRQYLLNDDPQRADVGITLAYICIVPRRIRTLLQAGSLLIALIFLLSFTFACRILTQPGAECVQTMLDFSPNKGVFQILVPTNDRTFLEKFEIKKEMNTDSVFIVENVDLTRNNNEDNLMDYLSYRKLTIDGFGKDFFYTNYFMSALEFSFVSPLLQLNNNIRAEQNITVRTIAISRYSPICFNKLINEYDTIMKANVKEMATQLAKSKLSVTGRSSKGFIRDLRTGRVSEIAESPSFQYRLLSSITFFYIFDIMLMLFITKVSGVCAFFNYVQLEYNGIRLFYNNLMARARARPALPISKILTLLMAGIGMDKVVMRFLENRFVMIVVLWSIFEAEIVNSRSFQSPTSRQHWYKFYFLYLWFFLTSELHYTQFTNLSFSIYVFLNLYTYLFFFHHFEIPFFFASNPRFLRQYQHFKQTHLVLDLPIYRVSSRRRRPSPHRNLQGRLRQMNYEQELQNTIWSWRIVKYLLQSAIIGCEYLDSLLPDDFLQDQPEDMEMLTLERIRPHNVGFCSYVRLIVRYALFGPERPISERHVPYAFEAEYMSSDDDNENENDDDNDDDEDDVDVEYDDDMDRYGGYNGADDNASRHNGRSETPPSIQTDDDDVGSAFDEVNLDVNDL